MSSIQVTRHPPMTAAERQRRCRENGKGRHRGRRFTKAQYAAYLQGQEAAKLAAAGAAVAEAEGGAIAAPLTFPSGPLAAAPPALAVDAGHLNLSAMAA